MIQLNRAVLSKLRRVKIELDESAHERHQSYLNITTAEYNNSPVTMLNSRVIGALQLPPLVMLALSWVE